MKSKMLLFIPIALFCCCTNVENIKIPEERESEFQRMEKLSNDIQALNASYNILDNPTPRGVPGTVVGAIGADMTGWSLGSRLGFYIGGVTGGLAGLVPGYYIGGAVAAAAFSAIAALDMSAVVYNSGGIDFNSSTQVATVTDSIGIIHNEIMNIICNDRNHYLNPDGSVNQSAVIVKCIDIYRERGLYHPDVEESEFIEEVGSSAKLASTYVAQYNAGEITEEELLTKQGNIVASKSDLTLEEVEIRNCISNQMLHTYSNIPLSEIPQYSSDLQKTIMESSVSEETKQELAGSAQIISNSTLCWKNQDGY